MTTDGKYGVAVLGTGWVSGQHIRAFEMNPNSKVTAIVSRTEERALEKIREHSLKDCKPYADYEACLRDRDVDIVCICTPNHLHCEQAVMAANAGKHLLVEKPLANTWEEALQMQDAVKRANVKTLVSYVLHFNPMLVTAKNLVKEGYLGKLFYAETDFFLHMDESYDCYEWTRKKEIGGSMLISGGCHAVDAMRQFMKSDVMEVSAYANKFRPDFEYDGTIVMILKFKDGSVGKIGCSFDLIAPYMFNVHLFGDEGSLINNRLYAPKRINRQLDFMEIPVTLPNTSDVAHHNFPEQNGHLIDCIIKDIETECSIDDAVKTQEIIFAAERSAALGKPIKLPL